MAPADSYKSVLGGKLSLKTASLFKGKKRKKSSKKSEGREEQQERDAEEQHQQQEEPEEAAAAAAAAAPAVDTDEFLTPAQKRYKAQKAALEDKRIKDLVKKTHREKVEEFNSYLSKLTEHNDIPRISAAGNG